MFNIHKDIEKAYTLPAEFYRSSTIFEEVKEKIFTRQWLYVADLSEIPDPGQYVPFTLLEGVLDEPLVLTHDREGHLRCLSNVCTHQRKSYC